MPTDRSLPWSGNKLRISNGNSSHGCRATPQSGTGVTSQSAQEPTEPRSSFNPSQVALRYYTDNKGARQIESILNHPALPSRSRCHDLIQEHSSGDKDFQKTGSMVRADSSLAEHPLQCHESYEGTKGLFTAAIEKLIGSGSLLRNGTANGLARPPGSVADPPRVVEAANTVSAVTSRSSANHVPPVKPAPPCLANGDETTRCVPDDARDGPGDTARTYGLTAAFPRAPLSVVGSQAGVNAAVISGDADSKGACLKQPSVYSVTNQISAIHLTQQGSPLLQQGDLSYPLPPLEARGAMGLRLLT